MITAQQRYSIFVLMNFLLMAAADGNMTHDNRSASLPFNYINNVFRFTWSAVSMTSLENKTTAILEAFPACNASEDFILSANESLGFFRLCPVGGFLPGFPDVDILTVTPTAEKISQIKLLMACLSAQESIVNNCSSTVWGWVFDVAVLVSLAAALIFSIKCLSKRSPTPAPVVLEVPQLDETSPLMGQQELSQRSQSSRFN